MADEKNQFFSNKFYKFKKFASENKFLVTSSVVLVTLVIILIVVYWRIYFNAGKSTSTKNSIQGTSSKQVQVLPQQQRNSSTQSIKTTVKSSDKISNADPFASTPILQGVMISGNGKNTAIIVDNGSTYVVGIGQKVSDYWNVEKIERNSVTLNADGREKVITLDNTGSTVNENDMGSGTK